MASYLLPSWIQKRLLRYALSRLELLDTDALDLEHLEVSWGTRSTLEFRDVGLRLKKLAALLQLPDSFDLTKARVLLLRLTIPVDIYSSPIVVEVDGVEGHLKVISAHQHATTKPRSPTNHDRIRKRGGERRPGLGRSGSAAEARGSYETTEEEEQDSTLPTAADLAASFLETEPAEERAELEAAISSQSQILGASMAMSDDGEDDVSLGTGTALTLPYFMANFLQGIMDRLQVKIHGIFFNLDVDLPNDTPALPPQTGTDPVTVQVSIADVEIEGVTFGSTGNPSATDSKDKTLPKDGKRLINLKNIRGALISDANLFATLSRSSTMSSPSTTHSNLKESEKKHETSRSSTSSSPILQTERLSSLKSSVSQSVTSEKRAETSNPQSPSSMTSSIRASDDGRFDDAPEDEDFDDPGIGHSIHANSEIGNSVFDDSAYLDEVASGQYLEDEDLGESMKDPTSPSAPLDGPSHSPIPKATSPFSTPRASTYLPGSANSPPDSFLPTVSSIEGASNAQRSTFLPIRSRPRLSESRVSRSQPLPPLGSDPDPAFDISAPNRNVEPAPESDSADDSSNNSTPMGGENLAESKIFSHEDAESMYMSALSQASVTRNMPGAWDFSSSINYEPAVDPEITPATSIARNESPDNLEHALRSAEADAEEKYLPQTSIAGSTRSLPSTTQSSTVLPPRTPPAAFPAPDNNTTSTSSEQSNLSSDEGSKIMKSLFHLEQVSIYIPSSQDTSAENTEGAQSSLMESTNMSYPVSPTPPGAFSVSAAAELRARASRPALLSSSNPPTRTGVTTPNPFEIIVGQFQAQFDVSVARLIAKLVNCIKNALPSEPRTQNPSREDKPMKPFALKLKAELISLQFLERLTGATLSTDSRVGGDNWPSSPSINILLRATLKGLNINADISQTTSAMSITLEKFVFGYAKESIVSFDADLSMRASVRDIAARAGVDVSFDIATSASSTRCNVSTLPIHISIDLQKLDETFSWFGGLSGVMNMGNSMASNATVTGQVPAQAVKKTRGVRFEAPIRPDDVSVASQNKVNARIGGLVLDLIGKECYIGVDTSAVKVVSREEGIGVRLDKIKISGPHLHRSNEEPAILAEISGTLVEYLPTPKDVDLDRLLSLITPSKSKYDRDDDILLETLLRQRRQGGVLRVTMDSFKTQITKVAQLSYLPELGEEVSRLSTVAKYLPEDDRPGLLSLVLIRDLDLHLDMNETLGSFRCRAREIEVAQITLPALVALSVGTLTVRRNDVEEVLGAATDVELREVKNRFPAIMARMIGDEMEPVIRVKLWNLQIEYRVPMIMALLGLSENASSEDMATSIALSVATLTDRNHAEILTDEKNKGKVMQPSNPESKPMMVDVAIRDCILALNPLNMPSKVLLVMTEAHISAVLPKDNNTSATAELSKGSLLVVDNVANLISPSTGARMRRQSFDGGSSQVASLCSAGYVSVSYISSAKAIVQVSTADNPKDKVVDIELHDDLLVLESCADSTQTLIATLGGLAPPMPPSREIKYRTKVIPVEDLLASLSGDAFGTAEGNYDFDQDFGPGLAEGAEDEDDNGELDFNSHYYQDGGDAGTYKEGSLQGSVLFDQLRSSDTNDGVLLESFHEKQKVHLQEELNFQEDHFGTGSILEGTAHRWNSAKNTYDKSNEHKVRESPLKVCIRDVHIIWNLFDGYDWQRTRDTITKAVRDVESKAIEKRSRIDHRPTFEQDIDDEETVIGDFLFNSIYIGIPGNRDPAELTNAINQELNDNATETESIATTAFTATPSRQGSKSRNREKKLRLNRSKHHKITFELKGVNVDLVAFPPGSGETQSSIDVRVHDFDIYDHVPTSTWKKFATYMHDAGERESGTSQIHIEILNVKPIPELAASEIVLKATVLPLRLHVDQDALDFITRFFEFKDDSGPGSTSKAEPPFLQRVEVNSITVKLDFKPKRVDYKGLRSGHTTEFMNFIVLDEADMVLRHTIIYGISGFDKLGKTLNDIWMPDIKRNQLPGILAGLAPVRSIANVGSGMRDLVVVPMREYRKDGRIVRSVSKGAAAFARTTGTELIKLGAKLAIGTQTVLQGAEEFLTKQGESRDGGWEDADLDEEEKQISLYADQPIGVVQGLKGAYASLERDLVLARDAIIAVPGEVMESTTAQGAAKAVLRRAPTVILRPVIGASKAISQTLMGATNSLDPQNLRRVQDKYKRY